MDFSIIDTLIKFLINHKESAYVVLFLGSMFETIIGFSFFVYGELFFLAGSIMAGMGILNIWFVIAVLYMGGIFGDSFSYFLGNKYGKSIFNKFKNIIFLNRYINDTNYAKGEKFFQKRGAISVFFARLLGPLSWITPFIAGAYKLKYKKFLIYNIPGIIIGIGQFIVVGYFFGRHFDIVLGIISAYIFWVGFIVIALIFLYYFLKKIRLISEIKTIFKQSKKDAMKFITKNFFITSAVLLFIYLTFLFAIFFIDTPRETKLSIDTKTISLNLKNCKKLQVYYYPNKNIPEQAINIELTTKLNLKTILGKNWIQNKIFDINKISFLEYIKLLKSKVSPVSSLYFDGYAQDYAFQLKSDSISKREHIRFWKFDDKNATKYYGSISYDDGYSFNFYNYFFTPTHKISKDIDKSRDFFYNFLKNKKDLKVLCRYKQTKCKVAIIKGDNEPSEEQRYFTDGKILFCNIKKRK